MGPTMQEGKGDGGEKNATAPHLIPELEGQREEGPEVSWEMPKTSFVSMEGRRHCGFTI